MWELSKEQKENIVDVEPFNSVLKYLIKKTGTMSFVEKVEKQVKNVTKTFFF